MGMSILFLISCIITARFFEKRKMRVAAVLYAILFAVVLSLLLFVLDFSITSTALTNILGAKSYRVLHDFLLDVLHTGFYGISVLSVIGLSVAVQVAVILLETTKQVLRYLVNHTYKRKFKTVRIRLASFVRQPFYSQKINLRFCRMLN